MLEISDVLERLEKEGVVDAEDGGYLYWLRKAYKKYRKRASYDIVALDRFLADVPRSDGFYAREIRKPREFAEWRAEMNRRLGQERDRLWTGFTASLASDGIQCDRPFKQADYTPELQNKLGICFAASMDWLRRKMWNATRRDRTPMHEVWEAGRLQKRLAKLDRLQSVRSNLVDAKNTIQLYDQHRTEHHRHVDERKAFGALLAGGTRREIEELDFERDFRDCVPTVRDACADVVGASVQAVGADRPLGVLFELTESVRRGHALALFRSGGADGHRWLLFDPNYGEYTAKTAAVEAGIGLATRWYELYYGGRFLPSFTAVLPAN